MNIDFDVIQNACSHRTWKMATARFSSMQIDLVSENSDSLDVVVNNSNTVRLFFDGDWECDCEAEIDPCIHVAITVQSLKNKTYNKKEAQGHIGYRFTEEKKKGLLLERVYVQEGKETLFRGQCPMQYWDREVGKEYSMELGGKQIIPRWKTKRLLDILSEAPELDVTIDNQKIKITGKMAHPICLVRDVPEGFRIQLVKNPRIKQIFSGGTVLYGDELRIFDRGLDDFTYSQLLKGIEYYTPKEIEQLVCDTIPHLKEKIPVVVKAKELPEAKDEKPYIFIETDTIKNEADVIIYLSVRTRLVYGYPPIAEVKGKHIVQLKNMIPIRKPDEEIRLKQWFSDRKDTDICPIGISKEYSVDKISDVVERLKTISKWKTVKMVGAINSIEVRDVFTPVINVTNDNIEVDWGGATTEEIFHAWQGKQRSILLQDGTYQPLPMSWLDEYGYIVKELLHAKQNSSTDSLPRYALFDLARLCDKLQKPPPPKLESLRALTENFDGIPSVSLPNDLRAELREYQTDGVNWLDFLKKAEMGGILADDMGLGKTLQALCILETQSLVVAPTSVLHNWIAEAEKFRPSLKMCLYHGTHRKLETDADVILTSYAILRNDIEQLQAIEWTTVVLDEAQAIKNPKSYTAQAAFALHAKFRLTLTGTPIENRLNELWSQMHFLCPGLLAGNVDFYKTYEVPISQGSVDVAKKLREKIKPFILRRMKKDVTPELPSRTDQVLQCTLTFEERTIYDAVRVSAQEKIVKQLEEGTLNVMSALEALLRLRQAACHTGLLPGIDAKRSSKIELLMEKLEEVLNSGHKALVFSQWTSLLDLIEPHLQNRNMDFVRLDGATRDRQGVVNAFQKENGVPIFLASLKAGGTGLNLTEADHVFLVDPWWNPAVEDQAADRAHRIGQKKPVIVYRLVAKDSVEERILTLQEKKRALAESALGAGSQGMSVTKEDLLALLQ